MYKLTGHSLTKGPWFLPESQPLTLSERESTSTITVDPETAPAIGFNDWLLDDDLHDGPIVWRVKDISDLNTDGTITIELEHVIKCLGDMTLFGEFKSSVISGGSTCTCGEAIDWLLSHQSDWTLGDCEYNISQPYEFSNESLFDGIETVTSTLEDSQWEYDMSTYPFVLHIRQRDASYSCEMREERNLSSLKRNISRSGMYTRLYAVGANNLKLQGEYISQNESTYGRIDHIETDQSRTSLDSLTSWAQGILRRHCEPTVTITISGLDLFKSTGETLDKLIINRVCRCPLPKYATTITERIVKKVWRDKISEPENVTITLANNSQDVTTIIKQNSKRSGRAATGQAKQNYLFIANEENLFYEIFDESGHVHGQLRMTEESLRIGFENLNASTRSEFQMTSESLRIAFENEISSTRSAFEMTSESLRIAFENDIASTRASIQTQANRISLVVEGSGSNAKIKAAEITASINEAGSSSVYISASKIKMDGNTFLDGILSVSGGVALLNGGAIVSGGNLKLLSTSSLEFNPPQSGPGLTVGYSNLATAIKEASVSGNTLTLTPFVGADITFSKATSLSDGWSGNIYTVTAEQNGEEVAHKSVTPSVHLIGSQGGSYMDAVIGTHDGNNWTDHGNATRLYLVQDGTTVKLKDDNSLISGTNYAQTVIPLTTAQFTNNGTYTPGSGYVGFSSVEVDVQGGSYGDIKSRFNASSGSHYIEAYDNQSHNSIAGSAFNYSMGVSGSKIVLKDSNNAQIQAAPEVTLAIDYGTRSGGSRVMTVTADGNATGATHTCNDYGDGWGAAYGKVVVPSSENTASTFMTVKTPPQTVDGAATETQFYITSDKNYVYLRNGSTTGTVVARGSNGQYAAGWAAAYGKVVLPDSTNTSSTFMTVKTPPSTTDGTATETKYYITSDKNYVYLRNGSTSGTVVARGSNGQYAAGWAAAYGKVSLPNSTNTSSTYMTVKTPPSTTDGTATETKYYITSDKNYVYLRNGSTSGTVVARGSNGQYAAGWAAAYGKVSLPNSTNTSSTYMTVKTPPSTTDGTATETKYYVTSDNSYVYLRNGSTSGTVVARGSNGAYAAGKADLVNLLATASNGLVWFAYTTTRGSNSSFISPSYPESGSRRYLYARFDESVGGTRHNITANTWYVPEPWIFTASGEGSEHQGDLTGGSYICIGARYYNDSGSYVSTTNPKFTWRVPSGSSASMSNMSISNAQFVASGSEGGMPAATNLSTIASLLRNNTHGWVYFKCTLSGASGSKWYRIATAN